MKLPMSPQFERAAFSFDAPSLIRSGGAINLQGSWNGGLGNVLAEAERIARAAGIDLTCKEEAVWFPDMRPGAPQYFLSRSCAAPGTGYRFSADAIATGLMTDVLKQDIARALAEPPAWTASIDPSLNFQLPAGFTPPVRVDTPRPLPPVAPPPAAPPPVSPPGGSPGTAQTAQDIASRQTNKPNQSVPASQPGIVETPPRQSTGDAIAGGLQDQAGNELSEPDGSLASRLFNDPMGVFLLAAGAAAVFIFMGRGR